MSTTAAIENRLTSLWETPKTLYGWFATVDHKELGIRYLVTAFVFLIVGGVEALLMRIQLTRSDLAFLSPEAYDQMFTMHGVTMIFWYASPILSGFAVYLVPLMIGARDMAFPRLNAFTYWTFLLSGIFLYISPFIGQAPHAGWFAYVPYTLTAYSPSLGMDFYALLADLPYDFDNGWRDQFDRDHLAAACSGNGDQPHAAVPLQHTHDLLASSCLRCLHLRLAAFFWNSIGAGVRTSSSIANGGSTFLWQQLFWFFGHPWVYVIFLPATGMISLIIPVFSRRPIVGYPFVAIATVLTGVVGFGVWLHHMFTVGMSDIAMSFFSAGSMTISIFTTIQVFAWVATIWKGRPVPTASMYYAVASVMMLVIGGLSGVFTGVIPVDWQAHNTYYVVATSTMY